jgi:hypothetical protein
MGVTDALTGAEPEGTVIVGVVTEGWLSQVTAVSDQA